MDQFISEIAFLKEEIIYLREDGKRKSNQISTLVNLLSHNVVMKENQNIQANSLHNTVINDKFNINSTFDTLNKSGDVNELRPNHDVVGTVSLAAINIPSASPPSTDHQLQPSPTTPPPHLQKKKTQAATG